MTSAAEPIVPPDDDPLSLRAFAPLPARDSAVPELLVSLMDRVAVLGDECGRWCAMEKKALGHWRREHPALVTELEGTRRLLVEAVGAAPTFAQQHLVATTVRLAQVARAFASGLTGKGALASTVAKCQNARLQLRYLHGERAEGAAHAAAAAECCRLGTAMEEAWLTFPAAERAALMAVPWEHDPEPTVVGQWAAPGLWGKDILRPHLRQSAPSAYAANDWEATKAATGGDRDGAKYVLAHLLPASARVLPLLVAAVRAAAAAVGVDHEVGVRVPPLKTALRMDEKAGTGATTYAAASQADHFTHELPRQASNVDVARVMLVLDTPAQVRGALTHFKQQCEVARVKNRFSPEAPLYGKHACRSLLACLSVPRAELTLSLPPLTLTTRKGSATCCSTSRLMASFAKSGWASRHS